MNRWSRPSTTALLGLVGAGGVLITASRTWAAGASTDTGLGPTRAVITGAQAVPALVGLVLAALAGVLVATTARRAGRRAGTAVVVIAAGLGIWLTLSFITNPSAALGAFAAAAMGQTGSVEVSATLTPWPWLALASLAVLATAGGLAIRFGSGWAGLSGRYDGATGPAGERGERARSAWDALSAGEDPTDG